jgi:hypothetical protein
LQGAGTGRNQEGESDRDIGVVGSRVRTLVVEAREDLEIAAQMRQVLGGRSSLTA